MKVKSYWSLLTTIQYYRQCIFSIFFPATSQSNLVIQQARLDLAQGDLDKAQAILDEKQRELDVVQAMYDAAMKEKQVCKLKSFNIIRLNSSFLQAYGNLVIDLWENQNEMLMKRLVKRLSACL